jgi:hypothetical protein
MRERCLPIAGVTRKDQTLPAYDRGTCVDEKSSATRKRGDESQLFEGVRDPQAPGALPRKLLGSNSDCRSQTAARIAQAADGPPSDNRAARLEGRKSRTRRRSAPPMRASDGRRDRLRYPRSPRGYLLSRCAPGCRATRRPAETSDRPRAERAGRLRAGIRGRARHQISRK